MNVSCAEVHVHRICRLVLPAQNMEAHKAASQQPPGVEDPPPLLPTPMKGFESGLLAPGDPPPPVLISVKQLYMLGLTTSPETRV